ncbi:C4-dicarboxylate transport protein [Pullulanibacillus camelliae]|uniref:C4-dicarboxylate transport protein n=1 Tax=Pullulanibacillus camelliae TaxID=1707096 RepID=A0A8J2VS95_9BACL|nr:cation:dicarboxylase symporter family transporter [Pullulanibacillus camelliae]GGE35049.1 C4-dicarboxylate transport protein [Pullulanibacillus camelliae]
MSKKSEETNTGQEQKSSKKPFYTGLGFQVLAGIILGLALGFIVPKLAVDMKVLGDIFLRLIKVVVAPLVFLSVVHGITSAGDMKSVGRIGLRAIIYFEIVSTIVLIISMVIANFAGLGTSMHLTQSAAERAAAKAQYGQSGGEMTLNHFVQTIVPDNFIGAFTTGGLLQVLTLSICFGAAVLMLKPEQRSQVEKGLSQLSDTFFKFVDVIMKFSPFGAFGAIAYAIGSNGMTAVISLSYLLIVMYVLLAFVIIAIFGTIMRIFGLNHFQLLRYLKEEIAILFATASSESVLPRLMQKLKKIGCSQQAVSLVVPAGYAFNLDGTSVYMPLCMLFLANAYGIHLDIKQQIMLVLIMMLTSKGAATVSGGTFIVFAATVTASGILPLEGLPLLFGINRFTSQAVCICNAVGNSVATMIVSKISGEFDSDMQKSEFKKAFGKIAG